MEEEVTFPSLYFNCVRIKKLMAFKGRESDRSEIVIVNNIIEKVNSFNYLDNLKSYEKRSGQ
jgi:hypothetical protein